MPQGHTARKEKGQDLNPGDMAVTRVLGASVQNKPISATLQAVGKIYWYIKRTHIFLKEQGK